MTDIEQHENDAAEECTRRMEARVDLTFTVTEWDNED